MFQSLAFCYLILLYVFISESSKCHRSSNWEILLNTSEREQTLAMPSHLAAFTSSNIRTEPEMSLTPPRPQPEFGPHSMTPPAALAGPTVEHQCHFSHPFSM